MDLPHRSPPPQRYLPAPTKHLITEGRTPSLGPVSWRPLHHLLPTHHHSCVDPHLSFTCAQTYSTRFPAKSNGAVSVHTDPTAGAPEGGQVHPMDPHRCCHGSQDCFGCVCHLDWLLAAKMLPRIEQRNDTNLSCRDSRALIRSLLSNTPSNHLLLYHNPGGKRQESCSCRSHKLQRQFLTGGFHETLQWLRDNRLQSPIPRPQGNSRWALPFSDCSASDARLTDFHRQKGQCPQHNEKTKGIRSVNQHPAFQCVGFSRLQPIVRSGADSKCCLSR